MSEMILYIALTAVVAAIAWFLGRVHGYSVGLREGLEEARRSWKDGIALGEYRPMIDAALMDKALEGLK